MAEPTFALILRSDATFGDMQKLFATPRLQPYLHRWRAAIWAVVAATDTFLARAELHLRTLRGDWMPPTPMVEFLACLRALGEYNCPALLVCMAYELHVRPYATYVQLDMRELQVRIAPACAAVPCTNICAVVPFARRGFVRERDAWLHGRSYVRWMGAVFRADPTGTSADPAGAFAQEPDAPVARE